MDIPKSYSDYQDRFSEEKDYLFTPDGVELKETIKKLATLYSGNISPNRIDAYVDELKIYPLSDVKRACDYFKLNNTFFPSLANFAEYFKGLSKSAPKDSTDKIDREKQSLERKKFKDREKAIIDKHGVEFLENIYKRWFDANSHLKADPYASTISEHFKPVALDELFETLKNKQ